MAAPTCEMAIEYGEHDTFMLMMAIRMVLFLRACDGARPSLGTPAGPRQQEPLHCARPAHFPCARRQAAGSAQPSEPGTRETTEKRCQGSWPRNVRMLGSQTHPDGVGRGVGLALCFASRSQVPALRVSLVPCACSARRPARTASSTRPSGSAASTLRRPRCATSSHTRWCASARRRTRARQLWVWR